jgi:hypothetical protein
VEAAVTAIEKGASAAVELPSLTLIVMFGFVPTSAYCGSKRSANRRRDRSPTA